MQHTEEFGKQSPLYWAVFWFTRAHKRALMWNRSSGVSKFPKLQAHLVFKSSDPLFELAQPFNYYIPQRWDWHIILLLGKNTAQKKSEHFGVIQTSYSMIMMNKWITSVLQAPLSPNVKEENHSYFESLCGLNEIMGTQMTHYIQNGSCFTIFSSFLYFSLTTSSFYTFASFTSFIFR